VSSLDVTLLRWFNGLAGYSRALDAAVVFVTNSAPALFGLMFLGFFLVRQGRGRGVRAMRRTIILAGVSGVVALTLAVALASLVYRPRPFEVLLPGQFHQLVPHNPDSSFPSDHATGAGAFAAGMWQAPSAAARWSFLGLALLVAFSRLVVGVHWPSDVAASLFLGWACAQAVFALARPDSLPGRLLDQVLDIADRLEARLREPR